jgi:ABC-type amino acid transport substrate-binding protein
LEISSSGKFQVASFTNNIPFIKKCDGRIVGAAVDLGNFVVRKLGVAFESIVRWPESTKPLLSIR